MRSEQTATRGRPSAGLPGWLSPLVAATVAACTAACAAARPAVAPEGAAGETAPPSAREALPPSFAERPPIEVDPDAAAGAPRLIAYPPVSLAEREGHLIALVEDLVIEERDERNYDFDRATNVVVDEHGYLYVHDSRRYRIVVYAPDGTFARAYGGAGEMAPFHLGWIALAGDRLAISTGTKVAVWSLEREHLYDRSLLRRAFSRDVEGTIDGSLVGSFEMLDRGGEAWYSVEKVSLDEDRSFTYGAVRVPSRTATSPRTRPGFAVTRIGEVFLTRADEYAVMAYAADGRERWVLTVGNEASAARPGAATGAATVSAEGPAAAPALAIPDGRPGHGHPLRADGHGNLYVFPYTGAGWDRDVVPVDVYSPRGERVFAGFIAARSWMRAKDEAAYGIETDGRTGRQRIVRYRIEAPFALESGR